jgi:hypothetical protein
MPKQLPFDDWSAGGHDCPVCQLPFTVAEMESRFGFKFQQVNPQLLYTFDAVVTVDGLVFMLSGIRQTIGIQACVMVYARGDVRSPSKALESILRGFSVSQDVLPWVNQNLSDRPWALVRTDDNGNNFCIGYYYEKEDAEFMAKHYAEKGHKQLYYVEREP